MIDGLEILLDITLQIVVIFSNELLCFFKGRIGSLADAASVGFVNTGENF